MSSTRVGHSNWYDRVKLEKLEREMIREASINVQRFGKKTTPGQIVSNSPWILVRGLLSPQ